MLLVTWISSLSPSVASSSAVDRRVWDHSGGLASSPDDGIGYDSPSIRFFRPRLIPNEVLFGDGFTESACVFTIGLIRTRTGSAIDADRMDRYGCIWSLIEIRSHDSANAYHGFHRIWSGMFGGVVNRVRMSETNMCPLIAGIVVAGLRCRIMLSGCPGCCWEFYRLLRWGFMT